MMLSPRFAISPGWLIALALAGADPGPRAPAPVSRIVVTVPGQPNAVVAKLAALFEADGLTIASVDAWGVVAAPIYATRGLGQWNVTLRASVIPTDSGNVRVTFSASGLDSSPASIASTTPLVLDAGSKGQLGKLWQRLERIAAALAPPAPPAPAASPPA